MGIDRHHRDRPAPFFGCGHHTPDRTSPERARGRKKPPAGPCPTCGGASTEGSPFVCMGCHAVSPGRQARLDAARVAAAAAREPERNLMRRSADAKLAASAAGKPLAARSILSVDERAELVAEPGDLAVAWLDSIGQPVAAPAPAAEAA